MIKKSLLLICFLGLMVTCVYAEIDLSSPEKTVERFFILKADPSINVPKELFYKQKIKELNYKDYEGYYKIVSTFQSENAPKSYYISLVNVRKLGGAYYILYLIKDHDKYLIKDWDRLFLPKPESVPNIEEIVRSKLKENAYAYGLKKE